MKVYSARSFGLLEISRGKVDLTDLGMRLADPKHSKAARVEAFLNVPLYKLMYDQLKGQPLPPTAAIERMMLNAGVPPKQKERARQVFTRSAKVAGFFDLHPDRLVKPELRDTAAPSTPSETAKTDALLFPVPPSRKYSGGGGGDDGDGIHPAILGLLRDLPIAGSNIGKKRRESLKAAFAAALDYIYPEPEE